ncbi:phospholipid/cholesterol/gamma-HCH transport system permease protein [Desulfomicrobium apsheronum]|uniref:Phospholipid/cholesterol/gamma-HCH transport system permease protein n=1 Tax=Desulfomicrobium apsheronum TaxID=52560 RepID=A0A1I3WJX9_9BACT|nr:ABC transporter permease [Desulfomicrobium apsheronum]MDY0226672.1 ABC transporter permease [Desulfomicrobium apsheronum]SFK06781.1 phospholipid/cholesterol/gamma-HCH transport system permease protein [Desulfomicrobium apsheronum]
MKKILAIPALLGATSLDIVKNVGQWGVFSLTAVLGMIHMRRLLPKILHDIYFIGFKSLNIIILVAFFTGMVLGLQGYYTLIKFSAEGMLGVAVALSLVRELGPVLTAIMLIGRAGSSISAEIGIMRISEQIDALSTMDVDPVRYLVTPKIIASLICFPLLTAIFDCVGILGGYFSSVLLSSRSGIFFSKIQSSLLLSDVTGGFVKSFVFAFIVITISCYCGYYTHQNQSSAGAEGVSNSTTSAVVQSCVYVLVSDYVITSFLM